MYVLHFIWLYNMLLYACTIVTIVLICTECEHALSFSGVILHGVRSLRWTSIAMTTYSVPLQPPSIFVLTDLLNGENGKGTSNSFVWCPDYLQNLKRQASTLLYTLGEDAVDVLTSTNIFEDNRKKYTEVTLKLDSFFQVRKNIIYECIQFSQRMQLVDESVERLITNLYQLVEHCEYGNLRDEMIRDRTDVGIWGFHPFRKHCR